MEESNIFFATNTFNYGGVYIGEATNKFKERKGDVTFFRQVMDYDALLKFKNSPQMNGSFNTSYYLAHIDQIRVLDPNFSSAMIGHRTKDSIIEAENKKRDAEYGYPAKNDYYPLLEEIVIDNQEISYADELFGKWVQRDQELSPAAENPFGLFIKQKIEKDKSEGIVTAQEAGLEDVEDNDPYYYLYEEAAGKEKKKLGNLDKAKIYEEKYESIFRIFSEVSQEEIIMAPVDQYSFVNAGPGTGKTYTLMKKITYMIDDLKATGRGHAERTER